MKVHLRKNKIDEGQSPRSVCASQSMGNGLSRGNSRRTYQRIKCVDMIEFLATPDNDRCTHCVDMGLLWINEVRKRKGKAPVASWIEYVETRNS